jgi:hypothetical protein
MGNRVDESLLQCRASISRTKTTMHKENPYIKISSIGYSMAFKSYSTWTTANAVFAINAAIPNLKPI